MTLFLLIKCFKIALAGWLSQLEQSSHTAKGRGCDPGSGHIPRLLVRCPGLVCMGGNCLSLMFLGVCVSVCCVDEYLHPYDTVTKELKLDGVIATL